MSLLTDPTKERPPLNFDYPFYLLHNKKRAVHNIAVYCKERYAEKSVKRNHVVQIFKETDFRI